MIKYSQLDDLFAQTGVSCEEYNDETLGAIHAPFMVYILQDSNDFGADGINYFSIASVTLEVITEYINQPLHRQVEGILKEKDTFYEVDVEFSEEQHLYSTVYSFEVIKDV